ncbi:hypothetical protein OsJ_02743 [Oryza sativa Japonica Group]|uniref:Uncharacterized protein n=1 Tax=Oryza sativa subsp. japonica TaxID=39947 RepID=B9EY84_ORYSJ|nr:hypothetical protein OsJ_02743 [Oryza sativa Japonica Group]
MYNEQALYFQAGDVTPHRSYSYPRASSASASGCGGGGNSNPLVAPPPAAEQRALMRTPGPGGESARRPVFRGKSLTDDILMRRFVVDEEATRRRNEMEVIRSRHAAAAKRRRLGPSPLRRMALAESESEADDDEEETTTTEAAEPTSRSHGGNPKPYQSQRNTSGGPCLPSQFFFLPLHFFSRSLCSCRCLAMMQEENSEQHARSLRLFHIDRCGRPAQPSARPARKSTRASWRNPAKPTCFPRAAYD